MMKIEHPSVPATAVVAFDASTAPILNGQSDLRLEAKAAVAPERSMVAAGPVHAIPLNHRTPPNDVLAGG